MNLYGRLVTECVWYSKIKQGPQVVPLFPEEHEN